MFRGFSIVVAAGMLAALVAGPAVAQTAPDPRALNASQDHASPYMRVFGVTPPPYGHVEFCRRDAIECSPGRWQDTRHAGSGAAMAELDRVNRAVNAEIAPMTDMDQYGVEDYWTIPTSGKGDCEDYALMKRQRLIRLGWPASALLMTVVFDERKEGHAVLTARTTEGDFILDNKTNTIKLWNQTPYTYVMRSSYLDPRIWMSLDPERAVPTVSVPVAGMHGTQ